MAVTSMPALHCSKNCFQKLLVTPHRTCIQNKHHIRNLNTKNYIINIKSHENERLTRVEYECFRHSSGTPWLGRLKGIFWSLHGSSPNYWDTKNTTKSEDISPGIKTKPQPNSGLPKNSSEILFGLSKNNPENSTITVQKQSRNSARTIRKQSQNFLKIPTLNPKNF